MLNLINEEIYKLLHKRSTLYTPIFLALAMLAVGMMVRNVSASDAQFYITATFAGTEWATTVIIIVSSTIISMEYEYGTIKHLVIQDKEKIRIFVSKFVTVLIYDAYLHGLVFVLTFPVKWLTYGSKYPFFSLYIYHQTILVNLFDECVLDFFGSIIIVGLIFLLACATKTSAVAVASGLTVVFIGQTVSSMLIRNAASNFPLIRWNPFNMLNMSNEWSYPGTYSTTLLTLKQLILGNVGYSIVFLVLAFWAFEHKRI
ncbi:ABC transporter permease [Lentilactobacillus raoultii]|uniref:ABC transporter permease n=1 Tax=Lentilactobacillus raoultii TaxID=1987503 RepID=A0ABW3PLE3_9LACO|nr:ABC transporter permease [Lentilactobacillus raoultii]